MKAETATITKKEKKTTRQTNLKSSLNKSKECKGLYTEWKSNLNNSTGF
jgi:hypothetical protein